MGRTVLRYCPLSLVYSHILFLSTVTVWRYFRAKKEAAPVRCADIRQGDKGIPVQYAQTRLNAQGAALAAGGIFGGKTKTTVTNFQQKTDQI